MGCPFSFVFCFWLPNLTLSTYSILGSMIWCCPFLQMSKFSIFLGVVHCPSPTSVKFLKFFISGIIWSSCWIPNFLKIYTCSVVRILCDTTFSAHDGSETWRKGDNLLVGENFNTSSLWSTMIVVYIFWKFGGKGEKFDLFHCCL